MARTRQNPPALRISRSRVPLLGPGPAQPAVLLAARRPGSPSPRLGPRLPCPRSARRPLSLGVHPGSRAMLCFGRIRTRGLAVCAPPPLQREGNAGGGGERKGGGSGWGLAVCAVANARAKCVRSPLLERIVGRNCWRFAGIPCMPHSPRHTRWRSLVGVRRRPFLLLVSSSVVAEEMYEGKGPPEVASRSSSLVLFRTSAAVCGSERPRRAAAALAHLSASRRQGSQGPATKWKRRGQFASSGGWVMSQSDSVASPLIVR